MFSLHVLALIVSTLVGLFIAPVSAWLQARHWPSEVEGLITVVLSTVTAFVAQWVASPDWTIKDFYAALATAGLTLFAAFQARARIWLGSELDKRLRPVTPIGSKHRARQAPVQHAEAA